MGSKENASTTKINEYAASYSKPLSKQEEEMHVGQGELYSPAHAIKEKYKASNIKEEMGVGEEIRKHLGGKKERILKKLAAAAVPVDALESARHALETVVKDATFAAHELTKDALNRIKIHLVELLPSLSPPITTKMVDDAAKEADHPETKCEEELEEGKRGNQTSPNKAPYVSSSSSVDSLKPFSRL